MRDMCFRESAQKKTKEAAKGAHNYEYYGRAGT